MVFKTELRRQFQLKKEAPVQSQHTQFQHSFCSREHCLCCRGAVRTELCTFKFPTALLLWVAVLGPPRPCRLRKSARLTCKKKRIRILSTEVCPPNLISILTQPICITFCTNVDYSVITTAFPKSSSTVTAFLPKARLDSGSNFQKTQELFSNEQEKSISSALSNICIPAWKINN